MTLFPYQKVWHLCVKNGGIMLAWSNYGYNLWPHYGYNNIMVISLCDPDRMVIARSKLLPRSTLHPPFR